MAIPWADFFVPPTGSSGLNNGDHTAVDEWPPSTDECYAQHSSGASSTITWTFDMSSSPGDKKGFNVWIRMRSNDAAGYTIDEIRLTDGTTTLWTDSAPGITVPTSERFHVIEIPDSAMSTDPTISGLVLELDVTNLRTGNNRLFFETIRMMKSPFTAAQEAELPPTLDGQDFSAYRVEDLITLGGADTEAVVVWPDSSGRGRHLVRWVGSGATISTGTPDEVHFASATRFVSGRQDAVTGNHIWHINVYHENYTATQSIWSHAPEFIGTGVPGDKNLLGVDNIGAGTQWVLMSGGGSGPEHLTGGSATSGTYERITEWIQDSGNEHLWEDDAASPTLDDASGSNNWLTVSLGDRESDDRPFLGGITDFWIIDGDTIVEADIDDARDYWVNGPSGSTTPQTVAATTTVTAAIATEVFNHHFQTVAATTTVTPTIIKEVTKDLSVSVTVTPGVQKKMEVALAATSTLTPDLEAIGVVQLTLAATTTLTAALSTTMIPGEEDDGSRRFGKWLATVGQQLRSGPGT